MAMVSNRAFKANMFGMGKTQGRMRVFGDQALAAAVVSSREEAENIRDRARDNLDKMRETPSSPGRSLKEGIKVRNLGDKKWGVTAEPVTKSSPRGMSIPYFVEFGRGPVQPVDQDFLYFRQYGVYAARAGASEPKPFFREAIKKATQITMSSINGGIRHVADSELE